MRHWRAAAAVTVTAAAVMTSAVIWLSRPNVVIDPPGRPYHHVAFPLRADAVLTAWRRSGAAGGWTGRLGRNWFTGLVLLDEYDHRPALTFNSSGSPEYSGGWTVGRYRLAAALPADAPGTGVVTFGAGAPSIRVPLISAAAALRALPRSPSAAYCGGSCATLTVIGVTLRTVGVRSSRGLASIPAWDFTLSGTIGGISDVEDLSQVAVAPAAVMALPNGLLTQFPDDRYAAIISASADPGGRRITVRVTMPAGATGPAVAVAQTPIAVVVGAQITPGPLPWGPSRIVTRTITLTAPIGDRPILDAATGLPIPPPGRH